MKFAFKKIIVLTITVLLGLTVFLAGCTTKKEEKTEKPEKKEEETKKPPTKIILATTTSTIDTGLLDELLPRFEKEENIKVKPIAVGSGEAIAMGQRGDADVLLVHSPKDEEQFMKDGYGALRKDVMYNDFVLIGPKSDPAGIKGLSVTEAMKKIAQKKAIFVSRADDSGTHKKEKKLWEKADIAPSGDWYIQTGQGMGETIRIADQKQGYTLSDRGTYLATKTSTSLIRLVEKDKDLLNPYGVIAVNPKKFPKIKYEEALKFVNWITSYKIQEFISTFGKDKYGQALFVPDSEEWKKKK